MLIELTLARRASNGKCLPCSAQALGAFRESPAGPQKANSKATGSEGNGREQDPELGAY